MAAGPLLQFGRSWLQDHHELTISPPAEDPELPLKIKILVQSTLGVTHYIGPKVKLVCHLLMQRQADATLAASQ